MERGVQLAQVAALATLLALGCQRKHEGNSEGSPQRIISLTPSATDLMVALGAADLLIGVDDYSSAPEVADLPRVGDFLSPSLEAIIRLDPDLVIVDDVHAELEPALHDAGLATLRAPMHSLPDVRAGLLAVGARLGRAEVARQAVARIDAAIDAAGARRHANPPVVLAVIDRAVGGLGNMVGAGTGSWLDELLAIVGGRNALASAGVMYPQISPEEILRAAPDVIVDVSFGATAERLAADWSSVDSVPAVANHRIRLLRQPYLQRPSPQVDDALATLEAALYE